MLTVKEKKIIDRLLKKYNRVLLHSMSIAVAEDFLNLIVVNNEDSNFELIHLVKQKTEFREYVTAQFFKMNGPSLAEELKSMDEIKFDLTSVRKSKKS
jgi:hypothetical protein